MESRNQERPEGWLTRDEIKEKYNIGNWIINNETGSIRNKENYRDFKDLNGRVSKHYSPELIELILKRESRVSKEIPPGARKLMDLFEFLSKSLNISRGRCESLFEKVWKKYPDQAFLFRVGINKTATRYITKKLWDLMVEMAPSEKTEVEVKKDFKKDFEKAKEELPEGSIEKTELAKYLNISFLDLEKFSKEKPMEEEDFCFIEMGSIKKEFWFPGYITKLMPEIYKFRNGLQPKGWRNRGENWRINIPFEIRKNNALIYETADKFRSMYPYMFWKSFDKNGKEMAEYYSPELISMICKGLKGEKK